jgi:VCBS repeat-containing protein
VSGDSNYVTIRAVNDAPVAVADPNYAMLWNKTLTVGSPGVLGNDTDDDSPASSLRAVLVAGPSHGMLTLNATGGFVYTPAKNYTGTDTFSYKANDGVWSQDPSQAMSADSNTVTVTITITKK